MRKETIYFAHPIKSYHTKDEQRIIHYLMEAYPNATIIDPATMNIGVKHIDCHQCMQKIMKPIFFKCIESCTIFVIWNTIDSCGIRCELNKAWELGKKVIQVKVLVQATEIRLQDYHYKEGR